MLTPATLAPAALERATQFVREHHRDPISVTDLADHAGYSRHHFSRAFSASLGISPGAYLTAVRIETAKTLLLSDSCPVIDVASEVGFDSLSSFTRRFAVSVGTTPAALRKLGLRMEDAAPRPFQLSTPGQAMVSVAPVLPGGVGEDCRLWLGWYSTPAPIGLPAAGILTDYNAHIALPLQPGAPWLLGFLVGRGEHHLHQLAPSQPVVGRHPTPITHGTRLTLHFRRAGLGDVPLLSALPALAG